MAAGRSTTRSQSPSAILSNADAACYVAKDKGRNRVQLFFGGRDCSLKRAEMDWVARLNQAMQENRLRLYYQRIVPMNGSDREPERFEVLLRLKDEKGVAIAPAEFMRAAERYRLMPHVDRWVVQTSLAALGRGAIRLPAGRSLCINLSGQTLGDAAFLEFVVDCLDRTGVAPDRVCFEVTENAVITNIEHARRFIGVLHGMGCHFALDDFGRGLSSFANLKNLSLEIPRGRFVTVEEIASLVAFCASGDCSFTTGAVFDISGGRATY